MKAPDDRSCREAGFTLIEILVGLGLLAIVAALIVASVTGAGRALGSMDRNRASATVPSAQSFLRMALSGARTVAGGISAEATEGSFVGGPASLAFATSGVPQSQHGGLYQANLSLQRRPGGPATFDLVLSLALRRVPSPDAKPAEPVPSRVAVLAAGIAGAEIAYYGALKDGEAPRWNAGWSAPSRLPLLVAIDVAFHPGDRRSWSRLVVPVAASTALSSP